jgi:hypothetical protein
MHTTVPWQSMRIISQCAPPTKTPLPSTPPTAANMGSIEAALAAIESLSSRELINYSKIAKEYGVVRSTLERRHRAKTQSRTDEGINRRKLNHQQEKELIDYIEMLIRRGLLPTRVMIKNFATCIAQTSISMAWVDRFVKRNSSQLVSH